MAQIICTNTITNGISVGKIYWRLPGSATKTQITLPTGVGCTNLRPCFVPYIDRVLILGQFNPGVVIDKDMNAYCLGIAPPEQTATLTASGTGIDGEAIGYLTWRQKTPNGAIFHESGPSKPTDTVTLTNEGRSWANLPTGSSNTRATHIVGWVSMSGADPRFCWEREIGTTSVTEAVPTLSLGAVLIEDAGVPPYVMFGETYHERTFYAGDPAHPERIWYSAIGAPENVAPNNYINTVGREPVTGIKKVGDELCIFSYTAMDILTGFDESDFTVRRASSAIGCVSHHAIRNIYDRLWFPSVSGVYVYDGSFKFMSDDVREWWADDFASDPGAYENSWAEHDVAKHGYLLNYARTSGTDRWWIYYLPCEPSLGGNESQPWWFRDKRNRTDSCSGLLLEDQTNYSLVVGSTDGKLRLENVDNDPDDDGDTLAKEVIIQPGHNMFLDQGSDPQEGKTFTKFWSYIQFPQSGATAYTGRVYFFAGDETAMDQISANVTSKAINSEYNPSYVASAVRNHLGKLETVVGAGITPKYVFGGAGTTGVVGLKWKGFGGVFGPGPKYRGKVV